MKLSMECLIVQVEREQGINLELVLTLHAQWIPALKVNQDHTVSDHLGSRSCNDARCNGERAREEEEGKGGGRG